MVDNLFVTRVRLDGEQRWGAMLGVMQTDMDKFRMVLRNVVFEISTGMSTLEYDLRADGKNPSENMVYQRMWELKSMFGGLYVMLDGIDGVVSSLVLDLLRGSTADGKDKSVEK